jgi:hypothetical protein
LTHRPPKPRWELCAPVAVDKSWRSVNERDPRVLGRERVDRNVAVEASGVPARGSGRHARSARTRVDQQVNDGE